MIFSNTLTPRRGSAHQRPEQIRGNVQLTDLLRVSGKFLECHRDGVARVAAMRVEHHQRAPVEPLHRIDDSFQGVGAAVGFLALVFGLLVGERGALPFECDGGFHLAFVQLALLGLHQELGLQLVLFQTALLFYGGITARVDGFIGVAVQRFARFRFECLGHLGRRF
jgi:hypothetical protein